MNETTTSHPLNLTPSPVEPSVPAYGTPPVATRATGPTGPIGPTGPAETVPAPRPPALPAFGAPSQADRSWGMAAHLSGFVAAWVALGFLGPLAVLLAAGSTSPFVRRHAVEALNFNLSVLLYVAISAVLMLVLIGFLALPLVGLLYLVATIQGAMAASRGADYRYPLSIRFVS
jgi:uncharacterized Tic20 family protein